MNIYALANITLSPFGSVLGRQDPETEAQAGLKTSKGALEVCGTVIVHTDQGDRGLFLGLNVG